MCLRLDRDSNRPNFSTLPIQLRAGPFQVATTCVRLDLFKHPEKSLQKNPKMIQLNLVAVKSNKRFPLMFAVLAAETAKSFSTSNDKTCKLCHSIDHKNQTDHFLNVVFVESAPKLNILVVQ